MRLWFLGRRSKNNGELADMEQSHDQRVADARARVAESEELLDKTRLRGPGIAQHVKEMRKIRQQNGFAAVVLDAFKDVR